MKNSRLRLALLCAFALSHSSESHAGLFTLPHFLDQGQNSVGFEPEVTFTHGGGVAGSVKYQHGLTEFSNGQLTLGGGTGRRRFRIGTDFTYDFVPDVEKQPGMGLALGTHYISYEGFGQLELSLAPYLHKIFKNGKGHSIEPFVAVPVGPAFSSGHYYWQTRLNMGAMFMNEAHGQLSFVVEMSVGLSNADTILSGGVSFRP